MGLLQKCIETYDSNADLAGISREGHEPLAPVSHAVTRADIVITIDSAGNFVSARAVGNDEPKIIIPVTQDSAARTSGPRAHPLCDQLSFLADYNEEKHQLYVQQLQSWADSGSAHPKAAAILKYVKRGTIITDLQACGLIEVSAEGIPEKEKFVCWRVIDPEDDAAQAACWEDVSLMGSYIRFYDLQLKKKGEEEDLCMLTGEQTVIAKTHLKGVVPFCGNAKIISSNDSSNFTYRGRFKNDRQAATVGYEASQKAHNALKWLVSEQGERFGNRLFLCWNPSGKKVCSATGQFRNKKAGVTRTPSDYKEDLKKTLAGYRADLPEREGVVIAAFEAATSGRLAITYYNELLGSDFLDRLYRWDDTCCWYNGRYGIQSPSLSQIIDHAYGTQRTEKGITRLEADDKVKGQQMQRMVSCRVDMARIPRELKTMLANRASSPQSFDPDIWRKVVFTACAVMNKYYFDLKGETIMSWQLDKPDRSFQFGRLLAVMERVEDDYYYRTNENNDNSRQTYAIKALDAFRRSPFHTAEEINRHLQKAYIPRVSKFCKDRYESSRNEIVMILSEFPEEELDRPLDDIYLMGYELQRNAFFKKADKNEIETEEE